MESGIGKVNFVTPEEELVISEGHGSSIRGYTGFPTLSNQNSSVNSLEMDNAKFSTYTTSSFLIYNFGTILPEGDRFTNTRPVPSRCSIARTTFPDAAMREHN
jgi:hypothetical protein